MQQCTKEAIPRLLSSELFFSYTNGCFLRKESINVAMKAHFGHTILATY